MCNFYCQNARSKCPRRFLVEAKSILRCLRGKVQSGEGEELIYSNHFFGDMCMESGNGWLIGNHFEMNLRIYLRISLTIYIKIYWQVDLKIKVAPPQLKIKNGHREVSMTDIDL